MPHSKIWEAFCEQKVVSTDTRKIKPGDIYFALRGDNFDGNNFAAAALEAGAAYAVIDRPEALVADDARYILVDDSLVALQELGKMKRESMSIPFIGITGSNGKTTTKELLHAVLTSERNAYATTGNLNNHIGVPLTLLAIPDDTDIAVIEMGANKPKDIEELVNIALPTHGLITNIGKAHLEGFGGIEGVKKTKGEMFDFVRAHNGFAWVNEGDENVAAVGRDLPNQIGYGGARSPYKILSAREDETGQDVRIWASGKEMDFRIQLQGRHNAENALVALMVGQHFGISDEGILAALAAYQPKMNRSQLVLQDGIRYMLDAYNANPSSMQAAIHSIALQSHQKVGLILGDMFELGPESHALHTELWQFARKELPNAKVIGIGKAMRETMPEGDPNLAGFADVDEAKPAIKSELQGCDYILIKGSRGMALERLLPSLGVEI